ncbi:hypothetical protein [Mangrovimonas sp. YM274]|uniref:hypothetical protein n=1 Tax=Mangrovimonas sp. YM274 TaxID=3070660 RepID=UPI0027DD7F02|nr:hypothetical protein [Mangrovimonas sp. YM274]WMI69914.1 hypothetical protein RBH95_06085 [Mangrovimonas sp. YM274]
MFLSHLTFFLSAIGFILFIVRSNKQEPFELFLTFFSFLFFSSLGVWLYLEYYYTDQSLMVLDFYGVINENFALLAPVFCAALFGKSVPKSKIFKYFGLLMLIGVGFAIIHLLIAQDDTEHLIFYPTNKNMHINAIVQLIYNISLLSLFIYYLRKINVNKGPELFDGVYKKVFSILFIVYYILDNLFFISILVYFNDIKVFKQMYYVTLVSNLIMTLLIITLAIYTNWLFLITRFKRNWQKDYSQQDETKIIDNKPFVLSNQGERIMNWNDFKQTHINDYESVISNIESLEFLTKTEKLYAALQPFNLAHKELADLLSVSLRTIETNFYRLRVKLRKHGCTEDYPYQQN